MFAPLFLILFFALFPVEVSANLSSPSVEEDEYENFYPKKSNNNEKLISTRHKPAYKKYDIGAWTYGEPRICDWGEGTTLKIGKYCSIAEGVTIFLGGNHRTDWVTTFPFSKLWSEASHIPGHPASNGNVVIGNDVWIGFQSLILSGVTIGDGAVIAARSVVTKNVPPYAIVGGSPAKVLHMRFSPDEIHWLLSIAWWNWPEEKIVNALPLLLNENITPFILTYY